MDFPISHSIFEEALEKLRDKTPNGRHIATDLTIGVILSCIYNDYLFLKATNIYVPYKKQIYELVLASSEYMLGTFTQLLSRTSSQCLLDNKELLVNFYEKKCGFSKGSSSYMVNRLIAKKPFRVYPRFTGEEWHFDTYFGLGIKLNGKEHRPKTQITELLPPIQKIGRNYKLNTFIPIAIINILLDMGFTATGISAFLQTAEIASKTSESIRDIKSKKKQRYDSNLAYVRDDYRDNLKVILDGPITGETLTFCVEQGQFRFRRNNT